MGATRHTAPNNKIANMALLTEIEQTIPSGNELS
jgi:hypothetical protein